MIGSLQRPLPDITEHSQKTDVYPPMGFELTISASERQQAYSLGRAATEPNLHEDNLTCNLNEL